MKIAFCSDISQFHLDRLRDRAWSQKFLGSAWVTSLYEQQQELGIEMASGDVALQRVKSGEWHAEDVHVIQEMDARHGRQLCHLGAIPSVLVMLESPLVAYRSVDYLMRSDVSFAHCIGPQPVFAATPALRQSRHWQLSFPSYWRDQFPAPQPWMERKHAVLVAANKYWHERTWGTVHNANDAFRALKKKLRQHFSATHRSCRGLQLHDTRLDLLQVLGASNRVEVFGRGWDTTDNMPTLQAAKLAGIHQIFKGVCDNKHELLSRYRFTIAFENTSYPGYVTEKIIDAMVASSVPVYLGAPDIADHLPANAFVDARSFGSVATLAEYLEQMSEDEAMTMIDAGQTFLRSSHGHGYTYEGFGEKIIALLQGKEPEK